MNFDIYGVYNIKSDNKDGNDTQIALISLLIYNIICEFCNVIIQTINKIVFILFKIHPMLFLSHVHNMLHNGRTLENNLPCYYFIDLHLTSIQCHVVLYRKYDKVGIHRAGIYLEKIHLLKNVHGEKYAFQIKLKMYSFLLLITYYKYYTQNVYRITQNKLDTFHYIPISKTIHSNIHILIIYILKMLELCMYNIVLLYYHLYSHIIIYTNVLFIVYWCTYMYIHFYSVQYFYTSIMEHSLYLSKGNVLKGEGILFYTPMGVQMLFCVRIRN